MQYNLKEKIEVTKEFLNELISKGWRETEIIQQQIANIDTSTQLGSELVKLLKNTCTNYYVFIGCLEALVENPIQTDENHTEQNIVKNITKPDICSDTYNCEQTEYEEAMSEEPYKLPAKDIDNFEPFEYFVEFDEPSGEPISDKDLYG